MQSSQQKPKSKLVITRDWEDIIGNALGIGFTTLIGTVMLFGTTFILYKLGGVWVPVIGWSVFLFSTGVALMVQLRSSGGTNQV